MSSRPAGFLLFRWLAASVPFLLPDYSVRLGSVLLATNDVDIPVPDVLDAPAVDTLLPRRPPRLGPCAVACSSRAAPHRNGRHQNRCSGSMRKNAHDVCVRLD